MSLYPKEPQWTKHKWGKPSWVDKPRAACGKESCDCYHCVNCGRLVAHFEDGHGMSAPRAGTDLYRWCSDCRADKVGYRCSCCGIATERHRWAEEDSWLICPTCGIRNAAPEGAKP